MSTSALVLVHASGLRKEYGSGDGLVRALDAVDLDVRAGEAVAVMGTSGCGKSTLLHLLGGLDRPSAGELSVAGRHVGQLSERALAHLRRDEIGFVFQAYHLMDELTAQENVELPALLAGRSPCEARARATALLEQVELADRARHLPSMLSGGQRQRVAIARALANDPQPRQPGGHRAAVMSSQPTRSVMHQPRRGGRRAVTGRALLLWRLAVSDLRHHAAQAVLLLVAIAAAATVLTLAVALNGVTSRPYQQTRAATRGPDAVAYMTSPSQATALARARGVTASSGPYPVTSAILHADGRTAGALVEGRSEAPAAVDQPEVLSGSWVRPGEVVLERTFAEALGVGAGGRVRLNGHSFEVAGIAVTAAQAPYPNLCYTTVDEQQATRAGVAMSMNSACWNLDFPGEGPNSIGLLWMTEPDAAGLASKAGPLRDYALNLRLEDPAGAPAFADAYATRSSPIISTWEGVAAVDGLLVRDAQGVLRSGALLLALLALASVAVLVGSRLAEHTRRVGLLKAVGGTPGLVAAAFLAENLFLATAAALAGLLAGWLAAPLLSSPGAGLVGAPGAPSLTLVTVVVVLAVALAIALAATGVPAIRAARTSTVSALADAPRSPKRRDLLIRASRRLPGPALLGLRLVTRRPRRAILSAASIAVTVMGIVAVLAFHADASRKLSGFGTSGGLGNPVISRDEQMLTVITILLVTLAVLTAIFTAWATVLDARRASAVTLALGATPRQVRAGLVTAQVMSASPGAILGVPLGIGLFKVAAKGLSGLPPALWLVATVLGTVAAVAALTSVPARIGTRRPVAEALQAEAA